MLRAGHTENDKEKLSLNGKRKPIYCKISKMPSIWYRCFIQCAVGTVGKEEHFDLLAIMIFFFLIRRPDRKNMYVYLKGRSRLLECNKISGKMYIPCKGIKNQARRRGSTASQGIFILAFVFGGFVFKPESFRNTQRKCVGEVSARIGAEK